ncbi:MAG: DUF2490 domain-containing protein [Cyclobacteriaceae bacterium]
MSATITATGQVRTKSQNNDLWFLQLSKIQLTNRWGFENELHLRLTNWTETRQQILLRPSIWYKLNENVKFQLGYTHIETYPYGDQPIAIRTPENNIWGQFVLDHSAGGLKVSHRYRLEERWTGKTISTTSGDPAIKGSLHRNRFRYRVTLKKEFNEGKFYATMFDEVWVNFGENTGYNRLDQNWLYVGFGKRLNDRITLETGYLWQIIEKANGTQFESNNTIQFTAHFNFKKKNQQ